MTIPDYLDWQPTGTTIGSGGQGAVHLVYNKEDCEKIPRALKILNENASPQAKQRFRKEIITISNVCHQHIIEVLDYSSDDNAFQFLVMDYHKGAKTIEEICLSQPQTNPLHGNTLKCLDLFEQIISAIQFCQHQEPPILHRDISPKNILVLPDNSIRLIDFGLCHTIGDTTITMAGENVGTRDYAPRECSAGNDLKPGTYTDIYSAAKILWSTITSKHAFDRENNITTTNSMQSMFPHITNTWHLDHIFTTIIQSEPKDRPNNTKPVLHLVDKIRHAITSQYPPLKSVAGQCPSCKRNTLKNPESENRVFGSSMNPDTRTHECTTCGFIFAHRRGTLHNNIRNQII